MDSQSMQRWIHWWNGSALDRPVMQIYAPSKNPRTDVGHYAKRAQNPETQWSDIENMFALNMGYLDNTLFLAEAAHVVNPNWSVGNACFFGCEPQFANGTVWTKPLKPEKDGYPPVRFDENSKWLKFMLEFTAYGKKINDGRFYLVPHVGNSAADALSLIRSDAELMMDIIENPEWVKKSVGTIAEAIYYISDKLMEIIGAGNSAYASWFGCVADKPIATGDADISCMLSPKQFEDIFLEQLAEQMNRAPYSQYHLDGAGALAHLPALLNLPGLNAIQWVPGYGHTEIMQWVPVIKTIQEAKKAVLVYAQPGEIPALLDEITNPEGLCICVYCGSEKEAHELLAFVEGRYTARGQRSK
ncbi:MAG: hypothetical protein FWD23_16525 [Oscillospiraceae bacterium]|nr:hypothetical protein [Oscillospiraceae bacterium]